MGKGEWTERRKCRVAKVLETLRAKEVEALEIQQQRDNLEEEVDQLMDENDALKESLKALKNENKASLSFGQYDNHICRKLSFIYFT